MRTFVTGATGFIGYNLTNRLVAQGADVKVLLRSPKDKNKFVNKKVELLFGDLNDEAVLAKACRNVDYIYNCAGAIPHHRSSDDVFVNTNVTGVSNLIFAAGKYPIKRFVHISTVGMFGTSQKIIDEKSTIKSLDIYSRTKSQGDNLVKSAFKSLGLPTTIIRPTIAYGPGDTRPVFLSLFRLIKNNIFFKVGDGKNYLHTVYIDNLLDGIILASSSKKALGEDFIIGDAPCPTFDDIVKSIAKVENKKLLPFYIPKSIGLTAGVFCDIIEKMSKTNLPVNTAKLKFITENRKYSIKKANQYLGYKPSVSLQEGLEKTYSWYRSKGYL